MQVHLALAGRTPAAVGVDMIVIRRTVQALEVQEVLPRTDWRTVLEILLFLLLLLFLLGAAFHCILGCERGVKIQVEIWLPYLHL